MSATARTEALRALLDNAAQQVTDDWHVVRQDAGSREDVSKTLGMLTQAIGAAHDGGQEDVQELAKSQLPRRLLSLLRSRVIRLVGEPEHPPDGATLLSWLGYTRDHLVGHRRVFSLDGLRGDVSAAGLTVTGEFGYFLKTVPNAMMLDWPPTLLDALNAISDDLEPRLLANIGVVARRM